MTGLTRLRRPWGRAAVAPGWGASTVAEQAWGKTRGAGARWAIGGVLLGALLALLLFAPAAWLAQAVASATDQRVLLADARGTVWSGSAIMVLTAGPGSRDASTLPGRLDWSVGLRGLGFELRVRQACCINASAVLLLRPGLGRFTTTLQSTPEWIGQWPGAFLSGLGVPFNTMRLGGMIRLVSPGLEIETVQGRLRVVGSAQLELVNVASRLSPLAPLGSYKISLTGDAANAGTSQVELSTLEGALQLSGSGTLGPSGLRFRGQASAGSAENEPALTSLLNLIGRRQGARSVISIG